MDTAEPDKAPDIRKLVFRGNLARIYSCRSAATGRRWVEKVSPLYMNGKGYRWREDRDAAEQEASGQAKYPQSGRHGPANLQNGLLTEWTMLHWASPSLLEDVRTRVGPGVPPSGRHVAWHMPRMWGSLDRWLGEIPRVQDRLPHIPALVRSMLRGIEAVQQTGFQHGDLKPGNILVGKKKGTGEDQHSAWEFCVADFNAGHLEPTTRSQPMCTYEYAAPECFGDGRPRDPATLDEFNRNFRDQVVVYRESDVWSIGIILLEVLTGFHYFWSSLLASSRTMRYDDLMVQRTRVEEWIAGLYGRPRKAPSAAHVNSAENWEFYREWWDQFLLEGNFRNLGPAQSRHVYPSPRSRARHSDDSIALYRRIRGGLSGFFGSCLAPAPEQRGSCAELLALFEGAWATLFPSAEPARTPDPVLLEIRPSRDGAVDAEAAQMLADPSFVGAWTELRQRLISVWISRSVHQAVRMDQLSMVDAAVLLPSATQLWDRWFWRRHHGLHLNLAAAEELSIRALSSDGLHALIMGQLGLHAGGQAEEGSRPPPLSDPARQLLKEVMCGWAAAVHMAGSWSGSWLTMEDLLLLRFRSAGPLDGVYAALEDMVEAMGPGAYTPTVTGYLGQRRPSGLPAGREYRLVYDQYMSGSCPRDLLFWTWGPQARGLAARWAHSHADGRPDERSSIP